MVDAERGSAENERVAELMEHTIDVPVLAEAVERQPAADAADTLEQLEDEAADILEQMDDQPAADALAEMEAPLAASVIDDLLSEDKTKYAAHLLEIMAPDDGADLLQSLDDHSQERLLSLLAPTAAVRLRQLAAYDEESAGGMMTTDFVSVREKMTVAQAIDKIRSQQLPPGLHHLLAVDAQRRFVGVVSLRTLLIARPDDRIEDVMSRAVHAVRTTMDREEVASQFDRYDYYMLAVVDDDDRLLGIVTVDDIIDIIRAEQTEDVQKTVGAGRGEAVYSTLQQKLKGRFPWLFVNLFTTGIAALIVLQFEGLIDQLAILAVLMPVIAAQAGNAGHQSLAVTLRGIVLDEVRRERVWPLIFREALVGLLTGLVLGLFLCAALALAGSSEMIPDASWKLGLVVALSMAISTCCGTLAGASIPLLMRRFGIDPATASAIFLIMVTDAVAFATFLGAANISAAWLGIPG